MMVHGDFVKAIFKYHADIQPSSGIKLADPSGLAPAKLLPPISYGDNPETETGSQLQVGNDAFLLTWKLKLGSEYMRAVMHFWVGHSLF